MASDNETVEDIVKRVRRDCNSYPLPTAAAEMLKLVREIEAAHKRELEDAIAATVVESAKTASNVYDPHIKSEPVGNAAKMREALKRVHNLLGRMDLRYEVTYQIVKKALAAPPRNCDAFSKDKVLEILKDRSFSKEDTIEWLYAEAKGE